MPATTATATRATMIEGIAPTIDTTGTATATEITRTIVTMTTTAIRPS
ncbi:hypothetical protein [Hymenobacter cavernae]|nr:hypothetical protein [Hymenobacter cavernae]